MAKNLIRDSSGRSIIVEYLGVPGAGKTTLSHRVAELLREKQIEVTEPTYTTDHLKKKNERMFTKLLKTGKQLLFEPFHSVNAIYQIYRTNQRSLADTVRITVNFLYICELLKECSRKNAIHFFDQGFFQALCSILYSAGQPSVFPSKRNFQYIRSLLARSTLVVISVQNDETTLTTRLRHRKDQHSRLDAIDDDEELIRGVNKFVQEIDNMEKMIGSLTDKSEGPDISMIQIRNDGNNALDLNTFTLLNYFSGFAASAGQAAEGQLLFHETV